MRQFFKFLFASCLGTLLALLVLGLFISGLVTSAVRKANEPTAIGPNSLLHLKLNQTIPELTDNIEVLTFDPTAPATLGLHDIVRSIEAAKTDDNIKGIFLETDIMMAGFSTTSVIREALADFKSSGKFIIAHAPYYTQGAYYLASVSDRVYLSPMGLIDWRGFAVQVPFMKDMLDNLGVQMQIFYAGEFKSATEPLRRTEMSPESKLQTREYLSGMYDLLLSRVSADRNIPEARLRELANNFATSDPEAALAADMVDGIIYREEVLDELRERLGFETDARLSLVNLSNYYSSHVGNHYKSERVAVVIAEGTIVDGKGEAGNVGDKEYVKIIQDLQKNDRIKAVVLRVNSPGGSAMASDHIWHALSELKAAGKPLVVSMGDYAASGGYYIACIGDSVFAQPSTLTGSIGVFSVFPNFQRFLGDKIGIAFDTVQTGRMSAGFTPFLELAPAEKRVLQVRTDMMYETFLRRVSDGRGMPVQSVDSVARGRVWLGSRAVELGLADRLGSMDDAVRAAAKLANLEDYGTEVFPKPVSPWERMLNEWLYNDNDVFTRRAMRQQLGDLYPQYKMLMELKNAKGPQMRLPFAGIDW